VAVGRGGRARVTAERVTAERVTAERVAEAVYAGSAPRGGDHDGAAGVQGRFQRDDRRLRGGGGTGDGVRPGAGVGIDQRPCGRAVPDLDQGVLLTGELADGTLTTWTGPRSVADHVRPTLARAAATAGRPVPAVVAAVCLSLTHDPDGVRAWVHDQFGAATSLPSYRAAFDREGVSGPADMVVAGDETVLRREIDRYAAAGVTELQVVPCGTAAEQERTVTFAAALSG
jgi:hypothetical protein